MGQGCSQDWESDLLYPRASFSVLGRQLTHKGQRHVSRVGVATGWRIRLSNRGHRIFEPSNIVFPPAAGRFPQSAGSGKLVNQVQGIGFTPCAVCSVRLRSKTVSLTWDRKLEKLPPTQVERLQHLPRRDGGQDGPEFDPSAHHAQYFDDPLTSAPRISAEGTQRYCPTTQRLQCRNVPISCGRNVVHLAKVSDLQRVRHRCSPIRILCICCCASVAR